LSHVDYLAEQVSKQTGARVEVIRLLHPDLDRLGRPRVGRYRLKISRDSFTFTSGDMRVRDAVQYLALVSDWINMGFVRLEKTP